MVTLAERKILSQQNAQLRCLANIKRIKIIFLLRTRERLASELAAALGISFAAVSQHVSILTKQKMIVRRRERGRIYYRLGTEELMPLLSAVLDFAPRREHEYQSPMLKLHENRDQHSGVSE